jgi:hypothetical protein
MTDLSEKVSNEEALLSFSIYCVKNRISVDKLINIICDYYELEHSTSSTFLEVTAIKYFGLLSETERRSILTLYELSQ